MKRLYKYGLLCLLAIFSLTACKKNFLDVTPTNSGDANTYLKTVGDAKVAMNGILRSMLSGSYYGRNFILYGDAKGGDLTVFSGGRGYDNLYTFNHAVASGNYGDFWSTMYSTLMQINSLLENIEKVQAAGTAENFDSYKGQALTLRALIHFDLVRLYGEPYTENKAALGVPIVSNKIPITAQPRRNKVEEVYTQVLKDLKDAETLLPKTKTNGYVNYYANKAIQARVYLNMADNGNALLAAEEVINSGLYTAYTPANWVASWKQQFGTESIFELAVFPNQGDLGNSSLGIYYRGKGVGGSAILGNFGASDDFLARLNAFPSDVRKGVMGNDETSRQGGCLKYSGGTDLTGDGKNPATAVNIKVIRLSEMYLIAAEAALPTDKDKAVQHLNKIRVRASASDLATTSNITLDMILDEKSKELFGEGHRFFDLMRVNKSITYNDSYLGSVSAANRPQTIDRSFYKTILPIPQAEINANPGMKDQQNPSY